MQKLTGRCLCSEISYEVTGELGDIVNCHCSKCRRWHGAAFRTRAAVRSEDFKWTKGEQHLSFYKSSKNNTKTFCSICGSNLVSLYGEGAEFIGLPMGGLEQDPQSRAVMNIYVGSKAPWYEICDALPKHDAEPPEGLSSIRQLRQ